MASSNSKFIQVSSSVLVEFIYTNPTDTNDDLYYEQNTLTPVEAPLYKYNNTLFNDIKNETKNSTYTGNSINRTFLPYSDNEVQFLRDLSVNPLLYELSLDPNPILYDRIKIHLISGFNFENNKGFIFSVKMLDGTQNEFNLLNLAITKNDNYTTFNSAPFYFANKYYTSYIEVKVLSLYNLIYSYYFNDPLLVNAITGNGIKKDQYIQCLFSWISNLRDLTPTRQIGELYDSFSFDLELVDKYSSISAFINVAPAGNYFEYGGLYNGKAIVDFLNNMNSSGYDYIMLHDIVLWESTTTLGVDPIWAKTQELQLSQTDFDLENYWRPVIKNPNTSAFKIDYTLRLFNRNDQSQIWKIASVLISGDNVAKFGVFNTAINIDKPIIRKIYNKNVIKEVTLVKPVDTNLFITKQIYSYINSDVSLSVDSDNTVGNIYGKGLSRILITEETSKLKFSLYKKKNNKYSPIEFTSSDTLYLNFKLNDNSNLKIEESKTLDFNRAKGEVFFRISPADATKILASKNRTFEIIWKNSINESYSITSGNFYSTSQWAELEKNNDLANKEKEIKNLNETISRIKDAYSSLNTSLSDQLKDKDSTIATLQSQINAKNTGESDQVANLQKLVNTLRQELSTSNMNYHRMLAQFKTSDVKSLNQLTDDIKNDLIKLNASVKKNKK